MIDVRQMNPLTLAYIGDAVLELCVRKRLVGNGFTKPNDLHQRAVQYVSAEGQAGVLRHLLDANQLDEEEAAVVRRGRNAKSGSIPKNTDVHTYRYGTAFEALIGYHYLLGNEKRTEEIVAFMFQCIEEGETLG